MLGVVFVLAFASVVTFVVVVSTLFVVLPTFASAWRSAFGW